MKKLFWGLIILFIIYFGIQWSFTYFSKGHEINYEISKEVHKFQVEEIFKANQAKERNNYYLKIKVNDINFNYQVFDNFDKKSKIIKDILYYEEDNNTCIIPIFKDNQFLFDLNCYDGKTYRFYHNVESPSESLKVFVNNLNNYGYEAKNWSNSNKILKKEGMITVYNNLVKNHYIGVSNYKGLSIIDKKETIRNVDIFNKDIYQRTISGYVDHYYITADYTGINDFDEFEVSNLKNNEVFKINSKYKISFNSYVLGSVESSLYIYDRDNRIEYEVNLKSKKVSIVGKKDETIKYYSNGTWIDLDIDNFETNQVFGPLYENDYRNNDFSYIIKRGYNVGYYYLFKKVDNRYQVYRTDIQNRDNLTYIFTTTDYSKIIFLDDFIYYLDDNDLKYYSDKTGNRLVIRNTEFEFNKTLKFNIYEEK